MQNQRVQTYHTKVTPRGQSRTITLYKDGDLISLRVSRGGVPVRMRVVRERRCIIHAGNPVSRPENTQTLSYCTHCML